MTLLGIQDPWVLTAYLGIVLLAIVGVIYGLVRRNAARDEVTPEDRLWALEEQKVENEI